MKEARAKLRTSIFTLECPHCEERQINARGSHAFLANEVRPNEKRTCTNKGCGKTFQLPVRLLAEVSR